MKRLFFVFIILFPGVISAQPVLTLSDAISIAMDQNFGIQIAALEQSAEEMKIYKANAGIGPEIDLNANYRTTKNNVQQKFLDGREVDRWGRTINPNADISLNITLYDGGRMQATYK